MAVEEAPGYGEIENGIDNLDNHPASSSDSDAMQWLHSMLFRMEQYLNRLAQSGMVDISLRRVRTSAQKFVDTLSDSQSR
jgi:hypothetical protein